MSNEPQTPKIVTDQGGWPSLQNFQSEMNRFLDRFNAQPFWRENPMIAALDVAESEDAIEVTVDVPGIDQDDLEVMVAHESLIIKGNKSNKREDTARDWHLMERSYGNFRRQIPLGFTPKDEQVEAAYANGVLQLRIEKPSDAAQTNRKIEIKAG